MSIQWWDGFDAMATGDLLAFYPALSGTVAITASGRDGTKGLTATANADYVQRTIAPAITTAGVTGFALYLPSLPGANRALVTLLDSSNVALLTAFVTSTGTIGVCTGALGGTLLGTTATACVAAATWGYVEFGWEFSTTTGTVEVRADGLLKMFLFDQNTAAIGGGWHVVRLFPTASGVMDDLYIMDRGPFESFLGQQQVLTALPASDGGRIEWTGSSTPRWEMVNDPTPDGDSTYITSAVARAKYTALFTTLVSTTLRVNGVQLTAIAKDLSLVSSLRMMTRIDNTDDPVPDDTAATLLTIAYLAHRYRWPVNPRTDELWTMASINAAEFGVERV